VPVFGKRRDAGQRRVEIGPMRIVAFDEIDLPGADIVLHRLLALDGFVDIGEFFVPNETMHFVLGRKLGADACTMFFHTFDQPVGDADIQCAARLAGEHVDPIGAHEPVPICDRRSMWRDGSSGQARG
jgi:hypothetical protein